MRKKKPAPTREPLVLEELEPRILFSAGVEGVLFDVIDTDVMNELLDEVPAVELVLPALENTTPVVAAEIQPRELVVVDIVTPDYQRLVDDILAQVGKEKQIEVVLLDELDDGISELGEVLVGYTDLDAVHLISHASDGAVSLGGDTLNFDTLVNRASSIKNWSNAFSEEGDFLIYGCNLAASADGQALVNALGRLTGADVAASDDPTGSTNLGGDWDLEFQAGQIETDVFVSADAQQQWSGLLAETIHISHEETPNKDAAIKSNENYGQTFSYTSGNGTYDTNQIEVQLSKDSGVASQNITLYLRESWDGPNLASATLSSDVLSTTASWETFNFSNVTLNDGQTYFIRLTSDETDGKVRAYYENSVGGYANGDWIDQGTAKPGEDLLFRVVESTAVPTATDDSYNVDEDNTLAVDWWNTDWTARQQLTFNNLDQAENLAEFPVLIKLNASNIDYAKTQNNGEDLRFVDGDGTVLAYEIEAWNEFGDSFVWVKVPQIDASSNSDFIWMYYGNDLAGSVENPAAVWASDYMGVWHLGEDQSGTGTNGVYQDSTSPTYHGDDEVSATGQDGQIGGGQQFDGTDDFIDLWDSGIANEAYTAFTFSAWYKSDDGTVGGSGGSDDEVIFFAHSEAGSSPGVWPYINFSISKDAGHEGQVHLEVTEDWFGTWGEAYGTTNVVDQDWHHVAAVRTGGAGSMLKIYVDGVEEASIADASGGGLLDLAPGTYQEFYIGAYEWNGSGYTDGFLDEASVSNAERTADWIAAEYLSMTDTFVTFGGEETAPIYSNVLVNDSDSDGDSLSAVLVAGPSNAASFTLNQDGSFTYTPEVDFNGGDSFTYKVNDGTSDSNIATVTITVNGVNDAPTANADSATLDEDGSAVINVIANDTDPESDPLSVLGFERVVASYDAGNIGPAVDPASVAGGNWIFEDTEDGDAGAGNVRAGGVSPDGATGQNGWNLTDNTDTAEYIWYRSDLSAADATLADANGWFLSAEIRMTDDFSDTRTAFMRYGNGTTRFLAYFDLDTNGDLQVELVDDLGPQIITLTSDGTGADDYHNFEIVYDPVTATAAFLADGVRVDNGSWGGQASANTGVRWGMGSASGQGSANYHSIEMKVFDQSITTANGATVTNNGDGTINYDPAQDFNGADSFAYTIRDTDGHLDTATVNVTVDVVNDAPVITSNGGGATAVVNVAENTTAVTTVTATDADLNTIVYSISGGADAALFSIDPNTGALTFIAAPNYELPADANADNIYEVTVQASDGTATDTQAISVTVTNVLELVVTSTNVTGTGSLHDAILNANANANVGVTDTITFNITGPLVGGAHTFTIGAGGLPTITDTVIIDGTTDSDYAGTPVIVLDGSSAGAGISGITLGAGSDGSTIRGLVINRFANSGIMVDGSDNNTIIGNYIGTDASGNTQSGSDVQATGITILNSSDNVIGGSGSDANVLSGNRLRGVLIEGSISTGNTVLGNFIGTNADGSAALTNTGSGQQIGVYLYDAPGNTIGGTTAGAGNVISGNITYGIYAWGPNSTGNKIQGNTIGLDASRSTAIGNGGAGGGGIMLSNAPGNIVGGTVAGALNVISGHLGAGVMIAGAGATGNTFLGNEVYDNDALGIDFGNDGVSSNDLDDVDTGANNLQNFPVISTAELDGTDLTLGGSLDTDGVSTQYRIELFGNAVGTQDVTNGEARVYLGTVTVTTDASGDATFSNLTLSGVTLSEGDYVTATATKIENAGQVGVDDLLAYGATSEFATNVAIVHVDVAPVINDLTTSVAEDALNTTAVTNLNEANTGNDTDLDGQALTYSITAGNADGIFSVDAGTGAITVSNNTNLDYETTQQYVLTVEATDGTNTDTAAVTVDVTNVNDNAPLINDVTTSVAEDAVNATAVTNLNEANTGNDTDLDGQALTYSITGGNTDGIFSIDAGTGAITVSNNTNLDYETTQQYVLTVEATDGTTTDTAALTIDVTNVNDNAPLINDVTTSVAEDAVNATAVANLNEANTGNDTDLDGQALTYSITAGNADGIFSIDAGTGAITVSNNTNLDYETTQQYVLTVEATDGTNTDTAAVTVDVTNVNDNAPLDQ